MYCGSYVEIVSLEFSRNMKNNVTNPNQIKEKKNFFRKLFSNEVEVVTKLYLASYASSAMMKIKFDQRIGIVFKTSINFNKNVFTYQFRSN